MYLNDYILAFCALLRHFVDSLRCLGSETWPKRGTICAPGRGIAG